SPSLPISGNFSRTRASCTAACFVAFLGFGCRGRGDPPPACPIILRGITWYGKSKRANAMVGGSSLWNGLELAKVAQQYAQQQGVPLPSLSGKEHTMDDTTPGAFGRTQSRGGLDGLLERASSVL
ncbi:unnamed protein product, partial [Ectocarpus sp. 13 AM-2016]